MFKRKQPTVQSVLSRVLLPEVQKLVVVRGMKLAEESLPSSVVEADDAEIETLREVGG